MHEEIALALLAVAGVYALCKLLTSGAAGMPLRPGRKVTVSLLDGSVLTGRARAALPGQIRLAEVQAAEGEVPGVVLVNVRHVLTVQVMT